MMLNELEVMPNKLKWARLIRNEHFSLGFNDVRYTQGVRHANYFLNISKTRYVIRINTI